MPSSTKSNPRKRKQQRDKAKSEADKKNQVATVGRPRRRNSRNA